MRLPGGARPLFGRPGRAWVAMLALIAVSGFAIIALPSDSLGARTASDRGEGGAIYFFADPSEGVALVGQHIPRPNPLVIRPSGFALFVDGQWVLEKLHWTGWGSPVAKARGLSSSSNDIPNAEEGKRIITWAKVRLSGIGHFHGHRIYRCMRVTVPPPAEFPPGCLQRSDRYIGLLTPGSGVPVGVASSTRHLSEFLSPDKRVWCTFGLGSGSCNSLNPNSGAQLSAELSESGTVTTCSVADPSLSEGCFQQFDNSAPVLRIGEDSSFAGIRCESAPNGITCTKITGVGKGNRFRVNKSEAVEVGA